MRSYNFRMSLKGLRVTCESWNLKGKHGWLHRNYSNSHWRVIILTWVPATASSLSWIESFSLLRVIRKCLHSVWVCFYCSVCMSFHFVGVSFPSLGVSFHYSWASFPSLGVSFHYSGVSFHSEGVSFYSVAVSFLPYRESLYSVGVSFHSVRSMFHSERFVSSKSFQSVRDVSLRWNRFLIRKS